MCEDWLHWCNSHAAGVVPPSIALAFVTKMREKCASTSPIAIQVKNQQKTISVGGNLNIMRWLGKVEWIVDICHNVRFTRSSVRTFRDNADRITESAQELKCKTTIEWTVPKTVDVSLLHFYCIRNKQIHCIEMYVYCREMYIYCVYSRYILYRSVCPLVIYSYPI